MTDIPVQVRSGGEAAEKRAAERQNSTFKKVRYFSQEDGERTYARFLTDSQEWQEVRQHSFVPTRPLPADTDQKTRDRWPAKMGSTCRKDKAFGDYFPDCFIDLHIKKPDGKAHFASPRQWALCVLREEVKGTAEMVAEGKITQDKVGKRLGFRDKTIEIEDTDKDGKPNGDKTTVRDIRVVNMGFKNFFAALQGSWAVFDTVLDRDYAITRVGTGTDTDYRIVNLDPTPGYDCRDKETLQKYADVLEIKVVHPKFADDGTEDTSRWILDPKFITDLWVEKATDEFYARFFDTRVPFPSKGSKDSDTAPAAQQEKPSGDAGPSADEASNAERLAAMRAKVSGYSPPSTDSSPPSKDTGETPGPSGEPVGAASGSGIQNFD